MNLDIPFTVWYTDLQKRLDEIETLEELEKFDPSAYGKPLVKPMPKLDYDRVDRNLFDVEYHTIELRSFADEVVSVVETPYMVARHPQAQALMDMCYRDRTYLPIYKRDERYIASYAPL